MLDIRESTASLINEDPGFHPSKIILPKNTIFFDECGVYQTCIVETLPHTRTINYNHHGIKSRFKLPLPYIIMVVQTSRENKIYLHNLYIFARSKRLKSLKDKLYILPLPNTFVDGKVCVNSPPTNTIAEMIDYFWQSPFQGYLYDPITLKPYDDYGYGQNIDFLNKWTKEEIKLKPSPKKIKDFFYSTNRIAMIKKHIINSHLAQKIGNS